MVSALWNACSDGNLDAVITLLETSSSADIEYRDNTGVTPLIKAVQHGHIEIVRALLAKGADPENPSSRGRPEHYTSDPHIQELLTSALQNRANAHSAPPMPALDYPQDSVPDASHHYYPPPPNAYYYPVPPPPHPDGAVSYYPPQPAPHMSGEPLSNGLGNLPPPEIARLIPCRYFPACRYGASCMFAHPQGPYISGPIPGNAQYPLPYDHMSAPYPPQNYYAGSPTSFPPQNNGIDPMSPHAAPVPTPPHPPVMHGRNGSEVVSPITHFSPQGPAPIPFNAPQMSPTAYPPHSSQVPVMTPLPPPQHPMPPMAPPGQQGPPHMYPMSSPQGPMPPFPMPREGHYPSQMPIDPNISQKSPALHPQMDGYANGPPRDGMNFRRGGSRKQSSTSRKPPCLFFPSGRCRNGNECRFPHVMPDANNFPPNRVGPKNRYPLNGVTNLENNIARMNINDDGNISHTHPSTESSSRSHSADGIHARAHGQKPNGFVNGPAKKQAAKAQRVPTSDEFPSLIGGSISSPSRSPGAQMNNGFAGLTAAQVLQAPPRTRKEESRVITPELGGNSTDSSMDQKMTETTAKGSAASIPSDASSTVDKAPLSFAAAAGAADVNKELSVIA